MAGYILGRPDVSVFGVTSRCAPPEQEADPNELTTETGYLGDPQGVNVSTVELARFFTRNRRSQWGHDVRTPCQTRRLCQDRYGRPGGRDNPLRPVDVATDRLARHQFAKAR